MSVRVRFAPSPTGYLHVGGARTALFNWIYARKHGGQLILRIEDTDQARNTPEARQAIFEGLRWLGIDWDEGPEVGGDRGPYFQSQRKDIYDRYLAKLEAAGRTYTEDNGAVRFRFSREDITVKDLVCGEVTFAATEEPDMTLRRPDGSYIFHFVNVIDDIEMGMTHVFRGEDHLSNTWKHIDLFRALDETPPTYGHIPLLLNPNGSKMSKRDEGAAVGSYPEGGFVSDAVFNYLCLLGWTPRSEEEKLDRENLVSLFKVEEIHSSNARFDLAKCTWLNAQYLRAMTPQELLAAARPFLEAAGLDVSDTQLAEAAVASVAEKISLLTELPDWVHYFFRDDFDLEADVLERFNQKPENAGLLTAAADALAGLDQWTEESIQDAIKSTAKALGHKPGALMPLLRGAFSGQMRGPGVATIGFLIGQDRAVERVRAAVSRID